MSASSIELGEVVDIVMGQAPPGSACNKDGSGTVFVKAGEFQERIPLIREWTTQPLKMAMPDDTLVCVVGATAGKVNYSAFECAIGRSVAAVRPKLSRLDPLFLYQFLQTKVERLRDRSQGAAQGVITREMLQSLKLVVPPLRDQRRIADILDKADALRTKRREALAQLDRLAQSFFLEMFGDPSANPKRWPSCTLGQLIHSASDGPHVSPKYTEMGIPFLSTRHVRPGEISWNDLKFLSLDEAEIQWKKCKPSRGDILYTKGGTTGFAAEVRTDDQFAVWVHVAVLKPNRDLCHPTWLEAMLNSAFCYRQSQKLTHGIANRDLGLKRMVNIEMFAPPLSLQNEFARRTERLASLKARHVLSASAGESLFTSLQDHAFSGRL